MSGLWQVLRTALAPFQHEGEEEHRVGIAGLCRPFEQVPRLRAVFHTVEAHPQRLAGLDHSEDMACLGCPAVSRERVFAAQRTLIGAAELIGQSAHLRLLLGCGTAGRDRLFLSMRRRLHDRVYDIRDRQNPFRIARIASERVTSTNFRAVFRG